MARHERKITDREARNLKAPEAGYIVYRCPDTPAFGVRVGAPSEAHPEGARVWILEKRIAGRNVRRTLGPASGAAAISREAALRLANDVSSELHHGEDRVADRRAASAAQEVESLTVAMALQEYVRGKRRKLDGLTLKDRTRDDYLAMVDEGHIGKDGKVIGRGLLAPIADRPINRLTADEIRSLHKNIHKRSERRAGYAMQVLRAVLRWHGVAIDGDPFSPSIPGRDRIMIAPTRADARPLRPDRIGEWWRATNRIVSEESRDYFRFLLLTGCRPGEPAKIRVGDCDLSEGRGIIRDPKNRHDHTLVFSRQVLEIVKRRAKGKIASHHLFQIGDYKKAQLRIAEIVPFRPKDLRSTFASLAALEVPELVLKKMMNHSDPRNITMFHYARVDESHLRAGWQKIADIVEEMANRETVPTTPAPKAGKKARVIQMSERRAAA